MPTLFREPFGETSDQVRADLASLRPLEVLWTVDPRDWAGGTTEPSPSRRDILEAPTQPS